MWVLKYVAAFSKYWQCLLLVLHCKGHTKQRPLFLGTRTCDITALEKPAGPDPLSQVSLMAMDAAVQARKFEHTRLSNGGIPKMGVGSKWVGSFWFSFKATQAPKQGDPLLRRHAHADQSKMKTFGGPRPFESQSTPGQLGKGQSQELGADAFVVHYIGCPGRFITGC